MVSTRRLHRQQYLLIRQMDLHRQAQAQSRAHLSKQSNKQCARLLERPFLPACEWSQERRDGCEARRRGLLPPRAQSEPLEVQVTYLLLKSSLRNSCGRVLLLLFTYFSFRPLAIFVGKTSLEHHNLLMMVPQHKYWTWCYTSQQYLPRQAIDYAIEALRRP